MKDHLGRQRFEGRSDTLSGYLGLLSILWWTLLLEDTPRFVAETRHLAVADG